MTTTITAALLLIGALVAGFATFVFLASATTGADRETLRLTWLAARYGRRSACAGLVLWAVAHPATPALYTLLLLAAGCAATASHITRGAPELMRRIPT
ncbi:MAG: hypothetical protein HOY79_17950 [Streptomyces sp.]|nr:hypothetical protein [Streptomyces sp.]